MTTPTLSLSAEFPDQDEARWRSLAEAALKGAPWERLVGKTADGVALEPLFRAPDVRGSAGLPGQAPFTRGAAAVKDAYLPWDIRQPLGGADAKAVNAAILHDLSRGVSSIEVLGGGLTRQGLAASDLAAALDGVLLDLAPVALNPGAQGLKAAEALSAHYAASSANPAEARPVFNLDPLSLWAMEGGLGRAFEAELADAAAFAASVRSQWPKAQALRANGRVAHEAGASAGQELAFMLASGVAHLRALDLAGVGPAAANPLVLFTLSTGPDVIVEIAKLRAARLLWARVMEACGAAPAERAMALQAVTSRRMMTRQDAWTNILRATAACFAAAAGGADVITVLPMTTPLGDASPQARRLARNTQIILMEESHLGRVADPGGGAFAVERLTADLAETAWGIFQKIEAEGGIAASLRAGAFQKDVAAKHEAASRDVARRKTAITGLSDFPLLGEQAPAFLPAPRAEPIVLAADAIVPLKWARLSEPFERLRDAGERSNSPAVFFANLGPLAEFSARANFAKNLFAVGGVAAHAPETDYPDHAHMAAALKAAGLTVAVLTGADARYAAEAQDAAKALKAAGCDWLIYAGKPADEQALRAAGFDQFIFAGQDAVEALKTLHASLGIAP